MSVHSEAFSDLAIWKIKYPISPLLFDKVRAKAFQALPVVFAQCQCPLSEAEFTPQKVPHAQTHRARGQWETDWCHALTACVCALPVLNANPKLTGNPQTPGVRYRFDPSRNKLQLVGNILMFAHIACIQKPFWFSLSQFRLRAIGAWLLMQS